MVLRFKERRSHLANNYGPEVCGKLLKTHWRGYRVDIEALHGRFPLGQSAGEGSKMRSCGYIRLGCSSDVFGVCRFI